MGKVSKKWLDKDVEERLFEVFWKSLANIKSSEEAKEFLESFISNVEYIMLAKRLGIALMLKKGFSWEEIENTLKVSSATIMSVSTRQEHGGQGLNPTINKILKSERTDAFLDQIEEFIASFEKNVGQKRVVKYDQPNSSDKKLAKREKTRSLL